MPLTITLPLLQSINTAVSTAFNDQLAVTPSKWQKFCYETMSGGDANVYPRLDMIPGLREWFGERVVNSLSMSTFRVANRDFEGTIGIGRNQIMDDTWALVLDPATKQLAKNAGDYYDILVADLMKSGNTTQSYDGSQNFFDTGHTNYAVSGGVVSVTTAPNYVAGANAPWFLLDTTQILKPFIVQKRTPPVFVPKVSLNDDNVFFQKEFIWGTDFRGAVANGIYQYAFMSQANFNMANLVDARNKMKAWRRPDGRPMGVTPSLLVVPSIYYLTAEKYRTSEYDPLVTVNLTPNLVQGQFEVLENDYLN